MGSKPVSTKRQSPALHSQGALQGSPSTLSPSGAQLPVRQRRLGPDLASDMQSVEQIPPPITPVSVIGSSTWSSLPLRQSAASRARSPSFCPHSLFHNDGPDTSPNGEPRSAVSSIRVTRARAMIRNQSSSFAVTAFGSGVGTFV